MRLLVFLSLFAVISVAIPAFGDDEKADDEAPAPVATTPIGETSPDTHLSFAEDAAHRFNLGFGGGELFISPGNVFNLNVDLQTGITKHLSAGLLYGYVSMAVPQSSAQEQVQTLALELSYFGGDSLYSGFWVSAGGGILFVDVNTSGVNVNTTAETVFSTVGWRWHADPEMANGSFGAGVGPQIVLSSGNSKLGFLLRIDVGVDFGLGSIFY